MGCTRLATHAGTRLGNIPADGGWRQRRDAVDDRILESCAKGAGQISADPEPDTLHNDVKFE